MKPFGFAIIFHRLFICAALLATPIALAAPVNYPLANPGFETPALSPGNSWYSGVSGWGVIGGIGTTYSLPHIPGHPAPQGNQFVYAAANDWHLFQQIGNLQANTRYWFKIDLFPLTTGTNRAEVIIEETDTWSAVFAVARYQPAWNPSIKDFELPAGQWTTVTIGFNSAEWNSLVGRNFRIRVGGSHLAVDNARLLVDQEIYSFYIANTGSDTNAGSSEAAPWRTFTNLAAWLPLSPGERVLLKRGDTFTQELYLKGKGTAAAPIELAPYGTGPKPIITRSNLANDICVVWDGASYARINQLDCRHAKLGIYLRYHSEPGKPDVNNQDLRIDGCNFKDLPDPTLNPQDHNYEFAFSDAIFLGGHDWISDPSSNIFYTFLDGLRITHCVAENTAHGFGTGWYYPAPYYSRLRNLIMEDNLAINCLNGWASIVGVDGGHMKRCHSIGGGGQDTWAGTTLGMIQNSRNFLIEDCVFAYCDRAQAGDGSGMDFEGDTINVTFNRNIVHNNDAAALLILATGGANQNLVISSNVFYSNARDPWNSEINSEIQGSQAPHTGEIIQNGIYRASSDIYYLSPAANWTGFTITGNRQGDYSPTPRSWNFNHDGNLEGWGGFNHWNGAVVSVGKLQGNSTDVDPYVHSPPIFLNPYLTPYVWVRMKHTAGSAAQIFYVTESDPTWDGAKSRFFATTPDGQYHDYFINLLEAGANTVITQMRLDPTIVAGASLAIDFVRFTDSTDPNQTPAPSPTPPPLEATYTSIAAEDGHVLESAQNSGVGGSIDGTSTTFRIGDDASNRSYRTILSFDTSTLPDTAIITEATIGITRDGSLTGSIPIGVPDRHYGDVLVDAITGSFSGNGALENADWQAAPTRAAICKFAHHAYNNLMTVYSRLETPDLDLINKQGRTQFRIRHENDDNNNGVADYARYASANNGTSSRRPTLKIKYVTNQPPAFAISPFVASAAARTLFSSQLTAADPDSNEVLTFAKIAGPAWLNVASGGVLSGTPSADDAGPNSFTARVTDAGGLTDYATLEIEVLAPPDANGNGILDAWEIVMFGNANEGGNLPGDDADGDGLSNFMEYAFNTHPQLTNASPLTFDLAEVGATRYLRLSTPKNPSATNLTYVVEVSGDLVPASWTSLSTTVEENTATRLTVRDNISIASTPHRFIRLKIQVRP